MLINIKFFWGLNSKKILDTENTSMKRFQNKKPLQLKKTLDSKKKLKKRRHSLESLSYDMLYFRNLLSPSG